MKSILKYSATLFIRLLVPIFVVFTSSVAYATNETVSIEWWPAGWISNDPTAGVAGAGVVSYDPATQVRSTYLTVQEYVMGVLNKECLPGDWGNEPRFLDGYKAMAISARNVLLNKHKKYENVGPPLLGVPYDILNSVSDQKDNKAGSGLYSNHIATILDPSAAKVISYPLGWESSAEPYTFAAFFSSINPEGRVATYNSEESRPSTPGGAHPFLYRPYMRNALQESYSEVPGIGAGGHGAGMSQFGAMHYSSSGWGFQQILQHYYHAAPPFVKEVIIKRGQVPVYRAKWEDRFTAPFNPSHGRELVRQADVAVNASTDLAIEVYFSEDMVEVPFIITFAGKYFPVNRGLTYERGTRRAVGTLRKEDILQLAPGSPNITISSGHHRYVPSWGYDCNPETVSFDGTEGPGYYEQGQCSGSQQAQGSGSLQADCNPGIECTDSRHYLRVETVAPKEVTGIEILGGNGKVMVRWTAPTQNVDGGP